MDSAFRLSGLIGFVLASALATALAWRGGLSLWVIAAIAAAGALTFLALALATKIVTGAESLTYYHHQTAILLASMLLLRMLHVPLLPYLDIAALGIGAFLACGRVGCHVSGCCHGLPCRWGVRYGKQNIAAGFPRHLAEVRLIPVQAIESIWVLGVVCIGTLLVVRKDPPGSALSLYLVLYAAGRFFFEFLRGGPDRPYFGPFSEAQWTSFAMLAAVIFAAALGLLPRQPWHGAIATVIALCAIAVMAHPGLRFIRSIAHPLHIQELAEALELVSDLSAEDAYHSSPRTATIHLASTAAGIQVSCGRLMQEKSLLWHYTLSQAGKPMTGRAARFLAALVSPLTRSPYPATVVAGRTGIFHLLLPSPGGHRPPLRRPRPAA